MSSVAEEQQMLQIVALVVSWAITVVAVALFVRAIRAILAVLRTGQPAQRTDNPGARTATLLRETLLHTRMLQWTRVGAAHWFIMVGFGLLFATLVNAYGQLFDPHFILPVIGHFPPFEWVTELFAWMMVIAIVPFMVYRATRPSERTRGTKGRLYGSTMWQGYFVEWVILTVGLCILTLRFLEYALAGPDQASALHFPLTAWGGSFLDGLSVGTLENLVLVVATIKIVISMVWMITIAVNTTMGVAWHRFLAFPNIWLKREASGATALGAMKPIVVDGKPFDLEMVDEMDEETAMGVGKVEDFTWKGLLDFTTCTECGRCQSQCPAWNTDKPLSPKLFITNLRDHAHAKAPYLVASESQRQSLPELVLAEAERPLVGPTEGDPAMPSGGAVIDPEVLWDCTSCGACVQQCPVDIEHVDHIMDMRRYQVLIESNFPAELNGLFKGLENKGNPWNMSPNARLEWAQGLEFDVPVVGEDVESLESVDWLFWVGCAGAYEDRAKKTTRAVAELLDMAGVSFAVLGNGETCTGDPARRAGNEFVFQQLAMQNAETFGEHKVKKVVATCAHCFNTLKNEYSQFGVELEVVHHTQLLNRLVREGRLTPIAASDGAASKRTITYHDPCYLGRHNKVYEPPRELLSVIPSTDFKEMERSQERSFCCGAGGARMWMEERTGERINVNRTTEAVGTGADQIAVGCPFCRVMLSDGLTMLQSKGEAREEVEILDVAQMLLASVKRAPTPDTLPGDEEADDSQYPLTVAHDGTEDPEQATEAEAAAKEEGASRSSSPASSDREGAMSRAQPDEAVSREPSPVPVAAAVLTIELPAGQQTVSRTWSGQDVETILEGNEVDISEFKTKLKAELKAEVLAELKQELEGALNSESGVSEPTTATTVAQATAEPSPAPAAGAEAEPEAKPETKKDDGGDPPPMLIGSL
ncbi:MAG TPA: (Fe-S)-binding protein [Marmoricola sp.]|nr:(Fe-S)-binding protein [Marmoricola sp.]